MGAASKAELSGQQESKKSQFQIDSFSEELLPFQILLLQLYLHVYLIFASNYYLCAPL